MNNTLCIDIGNTYVKGPSYKKMDQDIFSIIVSITTIIIVVVEIILYHRVLSCLERLELQLKLGQQDGKECGSDDEEKKDN